MGTGEPEGWLFPNPMAVITKNNMISMETAINI